MKTWAHIQSKKSGFTIVELLIVVVVIAILAAITIVAYNGIQNRAKNSATQSTAAQISKKISLWQIDNGDQAPTTLATAGIIATSGVNYEYSPSGANWCATVTTNGVSYYVSNTSATPKVGGCPGHAQNGTTAVTNLIPNTSLETNETAVSSIGNPSARTIERKNGVSAYKGDYVLRTTLTGGSNIGGYGSTTTDVLPNGTYTGSMWVRSNVAFTLTSYLEGTGSTTITANSGNTVLVPNVWTRIYSKFNVTSPGTVKMCWLSAAVPSVGTAVDMDAIMITSGDTLYNFADGSSNNWDWNGTANGSTSKGIPV